jgi:trigger factor
MQVTETLSDGLKRGYTVVVPKADIEGRRSKRLAELVKTINLPGFRPGKVPMPVVKQRYGTAVSAEVLEESVNDATQRVLTDRGLRAATQPKVDVVSLDDTRDLEFKVELELMPDIVMPDFAALSVTRLKATPSAEAVDLALGEIAKRNRELIAVEEPRPAAKGDVLIVDFLGRVDDIAFEGGTGSDMDVEVGGGGFIPGFTEQMEGMSPGESRVIHVVFPPEYGSKELAGKAATFDITAKGLKQAVIPPVDDELAKKLGFEAIDRVRELITQQIQREYDQTARLRLKRELLDLLAKAVGFPVPEAMLEGEFTEIWKRVEADRSQGQADDEDQGKDEETLRAEYRAIAERRVRLGLLLAEIGRVNAITVSPEELTRAMRSEAGRYPGQEAQVMEFFRKNPQAAENLRGPIFEEKVIDFVVELARVTEKPVTAEELAADEASDAAIAPGQSEGKAD